MPKTSEVNPDARIIIQAFKDFAKGRYVEVRCPSNHTLFAKFLVDRQLLEVACRTCSKKWSALKKSKSFVFHRYDVKMNLVETIIVNGKKQKIIERKDVN